jgi:hypothetical protein
MLSGFKPEYLSGFRRNLHTLKQRLEKVAGSLDRVQEKGASRQRSRACIR